MEFYLPASPGEWLAWSSAAMTLALGFVALFAPRIMLRVMRLQTLPDRDSGLAEIRASYGGFRIGLGAACLLLHPQPLLYLALGAAWLAGMQAGVWPDEAGFAQSWQLERRFVPAMPEAEREDRIAGWRDAVRRTLTSRHSSEGWNPVRR